MFYWFSTYLNKKEKQLDKIVGKLKLDGRKNERWKDAIVDFFFENPIETTIWFEYKYKGYSFLKKRRRRQVYETRDLIAEEFLSWIERQKFDEVLVDTLVPVGSLKRQEKEKLWKLIMIAKFLTGRYVYRESSAFWKLFPKKYVTGTTKLVGDCNQIVTFYVWLFSLIEEEHQILKIRLLKNHVCLNIFDLDFEATNGNFKNYSEKGQVLDAENIVAVNLLDIHDPVEKRWDVSGVNTAKMTLVASLFDVEGDLVKKNLQITYSNLGIFYLNQKRWAKARNFFEMAEDDEKIRISYINEALFLVELNKYKKALKIARKLGEKEFEDQIGKTYFLYLSKHKKWREARKVASKMNDKELFTYTYQKEYAELYESLRGVTTVKKARLKKARYQRLLYLAKKLGNKEAEKNIQKILREI